MKIENKNDTLKLEFFKALYQCAENAYAPRQEEFDRAMRQYKGSTEIDGSNEEATTVRNITYEIVESQVSSHIPSPKADATSYSEKRGRNAMSIERLCRSIRHKLPFDEMNDIQFTFSSDWQNITLGNGEEDFLFWFEKGTTYTFTLEVTLGAYAPLIERTQLAIDDLSRTYRQIVAYTTTSPDKSRDYDLVGKFPDLIDNLQKYRDELADISNSIAEISGTKSDKTGVIDAMIRQLDDFID